ncbi:N-terminal C2 in EEIG1 and EHBP1 proteins-domain-containing protein [Pseudoneurospora amorphoporcata]|uniref:N-terminal C2 in EEIG1 and EHBP1 proteins-domain-containing protein n=1 Tax=Pseudoneurospora amorphoporcata TaxID=241081 RepID=A0AAN6P096_9PEZI|nr:N-terminal C2 in EEIG1 and EHBP1 proteins-domain-containing protein [Pseudoneurospora amorphoporcata]
MAALIGKAKKPKFELHLKVHDLNNVPLVSGGSLVKWHFPHSIHSEHRGKTQKCPIANHRVDYNYSKIIPIRIAVDRNNNLTECPIEFEVLQLFSTNATVNGNGPAPIREEKTTLGVVRLNLAEYVEESESILRDGFRTGISPFFLGSPGGPAATDFRFGHSRNRSSLSAVTPAPADGNSPKYLRPDAEEKEQERPMTAMTTKTFATTATMTPAEDVQDGVVRRYLMQESKINSTLKISILMIQVEGERNFIAPPLKTAPVFGGIAGLMAGDVLDPNADVYNAARNHHQAAADLALGQLPSLSHKSRDKFEVQDCYRRVLAASWESQPGELTADQCIEDIFSGGDGFRTDMSSAANTSPILRGRGGYSNNVNSNFGDGLRAGHRKKHSFGGGHGHHFRSASGQYYRDQRDKLAAAISIGLGGVPRAAPTTPGPNKTYRTPSAGNSRSRHLRRDEPTSGSASGDEDSGSNGRGNNRDTLRRPQTAAPTTSTQQTQGSMARLRQHIRHHSGTSDKSIRTVMAEQLQRPEGGAADKDSWYNINNYGFTRDLGGADDATSLKNLLNSLNNKPNNLNTNGYNRPATSASTMTPTANNSVNNINTSLNNGLSPAFRDLGKMLSSAAPLGSPPHLNRQDSQVQDPVSMGVVITDGENNSYESNIGRMGFGGERGRDRSDSLGSLATLSLGSEEGSGSGRGGGGWGNRKAREVDEFEVRDDLVAWTIPAWG